MVSLDLVAVSVVVLPMTDLPDLVQCAQASEQAGAGTGGMGRYTTGTSAIFLQIIGCQDKA